MSCCSKKRQELTRQLTAIKKRQEETLLVSRKQIHTKFMYTGNSPWVFRGVFTRTRYHFRYKGHTITIEPQDAPAAMAESLLESVP